MPIQFKENFEKKMKIEKYLRKNTRKLDIFKKLNKVDLMEIFRLIKY